MRRVLVGFGVCVRECVDTGPPFRGPVRVCVNARPATPRVAGLLVGVSSKTDRRAPASLLGDSDHARVPIRPITSKAIVAPLAGGLYSPPTHDASQWLYAPRTYSSGFPLGRHSHWAPAAVAAWAGEVAAPPAWLRLQASTGMASTIFNIVNLRRRQGQLGASVQPEHGGPANSMQAKKVADTVLSGVRWVSHNLLLQTLLYSGFVVVFQLLTNAIRIREEFHLCANASLTCLRTALRLARTCGESVRLAFSLAQRPTRDGSSDL
jgi:hypothetical protein